MKPWAWLAIIALVIGGITAVYASGKSAGYDKRDQEVQQDIIEAQESARADEAAKWEQTVADAEGTVVVEERIVTEIQYVEKEIPKVVERIVELTPECADLGAGYARVRNDQVRASNGVQSPEATD